MNLFENVIDEDALNKLTIEQLRDIEFILAKLDANYSRIPLTNTDK